MAVICACIPSLRPLFSVVGRGFSRAPLMRSTLDSTGPKSSSRRMWISGQRQSDSNFSQLEELDDLRPLGHDVSVRGGRVNADQGGGDVEALPQKGITVRTEITLVTSDRLDYNDRLF